jgi:multidrug transporter EmrE-like cation transporter
MNAYGAANNSFNKSPANVSKMFMMTFLAVQAIRQLIQVNIQASGEKPTESRAGQVSAWMTITMTLLIGYILYKKDSTPTRMALVALIVATLASGSALIYDYITNKTVALAAEKNRLWFGIAHVIFALLTLVYFLMLAMD